MMTGDGEPVTVLAAPAAASARLCSRGEGVAPSTRNPTTLTGGDVFVSCFFMLSSPAEASKARGRGGKWRWAAAAAGPAPRQWRGGDPPGALHCTTCGRCTLEGLRSPPERDPVCKALGSLLVARVLGLSSAR